MIKDPVYNHATAIEVSSDIREKKFKKKIFEYLAVRWLEIHYPAIVVTNADKWLAVIKFAVYLDRNWKKQSQEGEK